MPQHGLALIAALAAAALPQISSAPRLALPLACRPGTDCFVQNGFDHDPGPGVRDAQCGTRSYDGHDGIDIRVPTMAAQRRGVAVVAAAGGTVKGMRDGMADVGLAGAGRDALRDRECGNGVLIAHADGWETQYCHMARGSIAVRAGQTVAPGAALGRVGLSGNTEFPHLHLALRHGAEKVDPFAPDASAGRCGGGPALWADGIGPALVASSRAILNSGFTRVPATMAGIEEDSLPLPTRDGAALVFYVRAIGLGAGDRFDLRLTGPDGREIAAQQAAPLDRAKAQWMVFVGGRLKGAGWAPGRYTGVARIAGGGPALERRATFDLR